MGSTQAMRQKIGPVKGPAGRQPNAYQPVFKNEIAKQAFQNAEPDFAPNYLPEDEPPYYGDYEYADYSAYEAEPEPYYGEPLDEPFDDQMQHTPEIVTPPVQEAEETEKEPVSEQPELEGNVRKGVRRGTRLESIEQRIERAQTAAEKAYEKYQSALAEIEELKAKKNDLLRKNVLEALENTNKSYEDILKYLAS